MSNFGCKNLQDIYLQGLIQLVSVKTDKGKEKSRTYSEPYCAEKDAKVCKTYFVRMQHPF